MRNRIDTQNQDNIENRYVSMRKDMDQLKAQQRIGTDSVSFYQNGSGNSYDWTGVPPESDKAFWVSTKIFIVEATAETQNVLYADLILELYVDNMGNKKTIFDFIDAMYTSSIYWQIYKFDVPVLPSETNKARWGVVVNGGDPASISRPTNTVFAKFYVVANDQITLNITEVN